VGAFLAQYLIGLREGLEMALVVSILVAFLVKSGRRDRLGHVWAGVGVAALLSIGFGVALGFTDELLTFEQQEAFEAATSLVAVALVTWMVFWMRRFARTLSAELRGKLEQAIGMGGVAVAAMAFLAVAREGLETAIFYSAAARGAASAAAPLAGITLGLLTAVACGSLIYAGAVRINLAAFFRWTGLVLILVTAGIFKYGVHDLQEVGLLPGLRTYAFDLSGTGYEGGTWYDALLGGMFNFTATPTVIETIAWIAYAVPVGVLFLLPVRDRTAPPATAAAANAPAPAASTTS
jgi:high-affinity iron transporter